MNIVEAFALFVVMIVVYYFFGLMGLLGLGFIIVLGFIIARFYGKYAQQEEVISLKPEKSERQPSKPCYPHGLVNCPLCYPNIEDSATKEEKGRTEG